MMSKEKLMKLCRPSSVVIMITAVKTDGLVSQYFLLLGKRVSLQRFFRITFSNYAHCNDLTIIGLVEIHNHTWLDDMKISDSQFLSISRVSLIGTVCINHSQSWYINQNTSKLLMVRISFRLSQNEAKYFLWLVK